MNITDLSAKITEEAVSFYRAQGWSVKDEGWLMVSDVVEQRGVGTVPYFRVRVLKDKTKKILWLSCDLLGRLHRISKTVVFARGEVKELLVLEGQPARIWYDWLYLNNLYDGQYVDQDRISEHRVVIDFFKLT